MRKTFWLAGMAALAILAEKPAAAAPRDASDAQLRSSEAGIPFGSEDKGRPPGPSPGRTDGGMSSTGGTDHGLGGPGGSW